MTQHSKRSRTEVAGQLLRVARLDTLRGLVRTNREWVKIVPGFRPQTLTRDILITRTNHLAREPQLLEQLAGSILNDLGLQGGSLADRLVEALSRPDLSSDAREVFTTLHEHSLWDLPLGKEKAAQFAPSHSGTQVHEPKSKIKDAEKDTKADRESKSESAVAPDESQSLDSDYPPPESTFSSVFKWEPSNDHISPLQDAVTEFERSLKEFTKWALKQAYGDRWLRQGCGAIGKEWRRRASESGRSVEPEGLTSEAYLGELRNIIRKTENRQAFDHFFENIDEFSTDMGSVIKLRNTVMHPGDTDVEVLQQTAGLAAMQRVAKCYSEGLGKFIGQVFDDFTNGTEVEQEPAEETVRDRVLTNLTDFSATQLVGRDDELSKLRESFWENRFKRSISIVGPGGVGKTALLDAFLESLLRIPVQEEEPLNPSILVYLTAKEEYLDGMDRTQPRVHFNTLRTVLETVVQLLEGDTDESIETDALTTQVYELCEGEPILFALDNLETLDDDEFSALGSFLSNLPASNKAVVTTRDDRIIGDRLTLSRLPVSAGVELLRTRLRGHDYELEEHALSSAKALVDAADGIPLAIVLSANNIANGLSIDEAVERLQGTQGIEFQEFSFGSSWNTLTDTERALLYFLAVSKKPRRRRELEPFCKVTIS